MYHGKVCFKDNETFCWRVWNAWLELFCAGDYSFSRKPVSSLCFTCLCLFLLGMVKDGTRLIGNGLSCCQKLLFFYGSQHACPNILTDAKHGVCYSDNTKVAWPGHDDISDEGSISWSPFPYLWSLSVNLWYYCCKLHGDFCPILV